jgi:hypothetical protein
MAWMTFAVDPTAPDNSFALFVKDQHQASAIFKHDLQLVAHHAKNAGIFMLGDCGDKLCEDNHQWGFGAFQFQHCATSCTGAYGLYKWQAAFLWELLHATARRNMTFWHDKLSSLHLGSLLINAYRCEVGMKPKMPLLATIMKGMSLSD